MFAYRDPALLGPAVEFIRRDPRATKQNALDLLNRQPVLLALRDVSIVPIKAMKLHERMPFVCTQVNACSVKIKPSPSRSLAQK